MCDGNIITFICVKVTTSILQGVPMRNFYRLKRRLLVALKERAIWCNLSTFLKEKKII